MARRKFKQPARPDPQPAPLAIVRNIADGETARVKLEREYIAPYLANPLANTFSAQPTDADAPEITFDTYRRMMRDGAVNSAVNTLVRNVLADGMQLSPAFNGQQIADEQPEAARAVEIADFVRRALSMTQKPLAQSLGKLLKGALVYGHKTAELTWRMGEGADAGKLVLDRVACKPHRLLDFALDAYSNHIGFIPRLMTVPTEKRILPREKFAVLTLHEEDEDPRGESSLRSAYTPWLFRIHTWPEYLRWLQNCAQNALIAKLPPRTANEVTRAATTNTTNTKTEAEQLLETMLGLKNASAAVVKNGTEIVPIEASKANGFEKGLSVGAAEIMRAITGQSLASGEAQFGTRAQSQTHMDMLDLFVAWLKDCLAEMVTADIVRKAVEYNYGKEALAFLPMVTFGDNERRDWSQDAAAAALLEGAVTDSQWGAITTQLGLPAPRPGERPRRESAGTVQNPVDNSPKNQSPLQGTMPAVLAIRPRKQATGAFITLRK